MHKIDPAYRGKGFELKREDFERCCAELLQKTIDLTRQAVQTSVDPNRNKMLALSQVYFLFYLIKRLLPSFFYF